MSKYDPARIEPKWQRYWEEHETFRARIDPSKPKFYILDMFPYPSGDGLHVGHPEGYTATDILARMKRMQGFNVLHPMGWDAFGLPAERHAVRTGEHPAVVTKRNCDRFRAQIKSLGFSYDWSREVSTADPGYYRWTQWIFLRLFERGLAYQADVPVNWCPALGTVLANEEVKDGVYVETGDPVEKRLMRQWMLKITAYAERLLADLDLVDWPEGIKTMQREWIGRSEGAEVVFRIAGTNKEFVVFTTRPDTLFGATYCVFAPEHPFVPEITTEEHRAEVEAYIAEAAKKTDLQRAELEKEKTGLFTGAYAINPGNGERIPIWIADYVLMSYGTGAIMAVPGHDERDWEFARKYDLPIIEVVSGGNVEEAAYTDSENGILVNSGIITGLPVPEAKRKITEWLEERGLGKFAVNYKLRDWLFSRQRYWGEPFPLIHLPDGTVRAVPDQDLPVTLPDLEDFRPTPDGRPPLARAEDWVRTTDPVTGQPAMRETNTMPQWAGSCWYYLRFCDPWNEEAPWSSEAERYWMPVDLYVGGAEHAVLHLLYARFWHKVLYDAGYVHTPEPFMKLYNQGMILARSFREKSGKYLKPEEVERRGEEWYSRATGEKLVTQIEKMSKSRYNVVNPDKIVQEYGADAMRLYEMFMGPLDRDKLWTEEGIRGATNFLRRMWSLLVGEDGGPAGRFQAGAKNETAEKALHRTIKAVTEDLEALKFNTAIARMMEFVNLAYKQPAMDPSIARRFILILSSFTPHLGEELWQIYGGETTLAYEPWPTWDESLCAVETIEVAVQVNGKVRARIEVPADTPDEDVVALALEDANVQRHIAGKTIRFKRRVSTNVVTIAAK